MKIEICMGSSCFARGNNKNLEVLERFQAEHANEVEITLKGNCCVNQCTKGPNVSINDKIYNAIDRETLIDVLNRTIKEELNP